MALCARVDLSEVKGGRGLLWRVLVELFQPAVPRQVSGGWLRKFGTGTIAAKNSITIYAFVKCRANLSAEWCIECLENALGGVEWEFLISDDGNSGGYGCSAMLTSKGVAVKVEGRDDACDEVHGSVGGNSGACGMVSEVAGVATAKQR
ncbi:hypothetical protein L1987_82914 [Smallanthus sonchifolius]|uniref:Uncharacterized protein n=1 Tax=Smallanthus sonchifolius TaxID=185202 RepID=A0ACB8YB76_9ASTR|nr:hypothetical protein L1987_82914 [Smallanthus sonchifolius]